MLNNHSALTALCASATGIGIPMTTAIVAPAFFRFLLP